MNLRAVLAEALGTFVLVAMGSMAIVSATGLGQGTGDVIILLVAPFGFGLGVFAAINLFGHVSGGHFNPAVTLGALLDGRVDVVNAILYVIAQALGAVAASLSIRILLSPSLVDLTRTVPAQGVADGQAFAVEAIFTTIFVAVILTVTKRQPSFAPLVIGLTLAGIHFAAIPITGAAVNPARALAPAIVAGKYASLWVYLTAPFVGALLGWAMYKFFGQDDDDVEIEYEDEDELEAEIDDLPAR